ncbi:hypothetical protein [uncultured Spirosoma sp.]|uniref:hypothetical protein n=1 Tax=uncultured Spirosoma sp. TaxID=278208 RepID=UPI000AF46648|nr:hypothetical protein [uncultured Spirosoma sp.]
MYQYLVLCSLIGVTGVILVDKWKVDNYMNVRGVRWWPREPCRLCRAFWFGVICYVSLLLWPSIIYLWVPLACIPIQKIVGKLST